MTQPSVSSTYCYIGMRACTLASEIEIINGLPIRECEMSMPFAMMQEMWDSNDACDNQ